MSVPGNNTDLIKLPEVMAKVQKEVDKCNQVFSHPEQIKKFVLLADEWTIDTGELTPSLKLKRKVIEQKYNMKIEEMYN